MPSPTTVVADLNDFFADSRVNDVFSGAGLNALASFRFWESVIFWIVFVNLILYIIGVVYSYRLDKEHSGLDKKFVWAPTLEKK